jgi:hypothetical protein
VHGAYAGDPWSTEHSTDAPDSAVNWNDGVLSFVGPAGPESIDRDGGVASIENDRVATDAFPAASVARTRKVYDPSANAAAV